MKVKALLAIAGLLVLILFVCAYTVDETEQVVITRFDKVQRTVTTPGLRFKLPVIEKALVFPKNLQEWDGDPGQIPTKDKTYIWVNTFARWKIVDPVVFFKTVGYLSRAQQRLDEIIDPTVRNFITSNRLIEAVRNSNRELDTFEDLGDDANQETHTDRPDLLRCTSAATKSTPAFSRRLSPNCPISALNWWMSKSSGSTMSKRSENPSTTG